MCGDMLASGVWRVACDVVQHRRCPRRSRQDAANNEKECPGKTEGGKGIGGEREGPAQTLPEYHHIVILFGLLGSSSVLGALS